MPNTEQHSSLWWSNSTFVLAPNNEGMETNTLRVKYGDGINTWENLEYSGLKRVGRNLVVDASFPNYAYKDTIIDGNSINLQDRVIDGNSKTIQDVG